MASVECMAMRRSLAWVEEITSHPAASGGTKHHIYDEIEQWTREWEEKNHSIIIFFIIGNSSRIALLFSGNIWQIKIFRLFLFYKYRKVNCSKSQEKKVLLISFRWVSELYVELLLRRARVLNDSKVASSNDRTKHFTISNLWPRARFPGSLKEMGELSEIIKDFTRRRCTFLGLMAEKITRCLRKAPR